MALYIYQSDVNDFLNYDTAANSKIRRYILNVCALFGNSYIVNVPFELIKPS